MTERRAAHRAVMATHLASPSGSRTLFYQINDVNERAFGAKSRRQSHGRILRCCCVFVNIKIDEARMPQQDRSFPGARASRLPFLKLNA